MVFYHIRNFLLFILIGILLIGCRSAVVVYEPGISMEQLVDASRKGELPAVLSSAAKYSDTDSSQLGEKVITYFPVNFQGSFTVIRLTITDAPADTSLFTLSFGDSATYYNFFGYLPNSEKISGYGHLFDYTRTDSFSDSLKSYFKTSGRRSIIGDSYMLSKDGFVVSTSFDGSVITTQITKVRDITKEQVDSLVQIMKSIKR